MGLYYIIASFFNPRGDYARKEEDGIYDNGNVKD